MILSSLIAINSGGVVALPALAVFLDLKTTAEKISVFVWPGACYMTGLLLALLSTLIAYFNFSRISAEEMRNCASAISGRSASRY